MKLFTVMSSFVLLGTSCAVVPDSTGDGARGLAEMMRGGRSDPSGVDTTTSPLMLERKAQSSGEVPSGSPCGPSRCEEGQFCCNESCGLCAPRGSLCLQRQCGPSPGAVTQCVADSDCRSVSNYCEGCQCLSIGALELEPACHGQIVACLLDPCREKHAGCVNGACALVDK
jgi:hypothetical protein